MSNNTLYNYFPVVYEKTLGKILHVEIRNMTPNPMNFTLKSRAFMDPFDVRLYTTFTFLNAEPDTSKWNPKSGKLNNSDINKIILSMTIPKTPVKRLKLRQSEYKTNIAKQQTNSSTAEVYGSDQDAFDRIVQLPINQELKLGTLFTLNESNAVSESHEEFVQPYAKMILSESIVPKDDIKIIPFHRRTPLMVLLPGEYINAIFAVEKADINLAANSVDWWSRPEPNIIRLGTRISENPFDIIGEHCPPEYQKVLSDTSKDVEKIINDIYKTNAH